MMVKLGGVLVVAPAFLAPAALLALSGGGIGQIYMKAQLNVKREMSNAKAPVLGHFGSTMAGIGNSFLEITCIAPDKLVMPQSPCALSAQNKGSVKD